MVEGAARHLRDQGDHIGADGLVFAARGIAEADHLDAFFGIENSVLSAVTGDVCPFGIEKFGGGRGPTSGEDQGEEEGFSHALEPAALRLMRG